MPEEVTFMDREELLNFEEITAFVRVAVPLGIDKIRLTGGEPLMRRDLPRLVRMLAPIPGIRDIGTTTNGILLADQAQELYDAGLRRINISLDTLDEARFRQIARRDGLDKVLDGIFAAKKAGFEPIKINAVSLRGITDKEVVPLAKFAREQGLEMRFIEYMPIGADQWERDKVYFADEIIAQISDQICPLVAIESADPSAPAQEYCYADGNGRIGIIASISRPFCMSCNRIRLTADGKLRNCLFAIDEVDVKGLLRSGAAEQEIADVIIRNITAKWEGHEINTSRFVKPLRTMHAIGG